MVCRMLRHIIAHSFGVRSSTSARWHFHKHLIIYSTLITHRDARRLQHKLLSPVLGKRTSCLAHDDNGADIHSAANAINHSSDSPNEFQIQTIIFGATSFDVALGWCHLALTWNGDYGGYIGHFEKTKIHFIGECDAISFS